MTKRITSLILAVLLMLSVAAVAFAADEAEADEPAVAPEIHFDTKDTGWTGFSWVAFHVWAIDDEEFEGLKWNAKKQRGTDADKDGVWTYNFDTAGLTLKEGKQYAVIFYDNNGNQTYNLLFDTNCYGDVAYVDPGTIYENPTDSQKTTQSAFWKNQDPAVNGPQLSVTSIGNVVGTCMPKSVTGVEMLQDFIENTLENAVEYSDKTAQELIDDIGAKLDVTRDDVQSIVDALETPVEWSYDDSTLPGGEPAFVPYIKGDLTNDGKVNNRDAVILDRYVASWDGYDEMIENRDAADLTNDGKVNNRDAVILDRYVASWDGYDVYIVEVTSQG